MSDTKEFKKFEKNLNNILNSSAGAASWSDLLSFTKEIYKQLDDKKEKLNFGLISDKNSLSKRLAQCLNPECPAGVHEVVISIYDMILKNILAKNNGKLGDNLGIYSCGLFPFFSYASKNNKILILEKLVKSCYLKLEQNELHICLSGLLSSLIPGLDDNNEEITLKIYTVFDELKKKMKPGVFYGTYWSLLLRNPLLRISGIKYLLERIIKYENFAALNEEQKKEILDDEFPNADSLIVNSLSELIGEKEVVTIRSSMDFIIFRLPLLKDNTIISENSKIFLIQSALKLLIKNEYSTTRRLSNWLLGINSPEDEINYDSPDINYKMNLIEEALKNMIKSKESINSENLKNYIRIIDQLFLQQVDFVDFILPKISYDLILCFVGFWQTELNSSENAINNETIKKLSKFFKKEDNYINLWKSIVKHLDTIQNKEDINYDANDFTNVTNLEKFIYETIQPLKFCFLFIDLQSSSERIKYYIPIINNLIKIINKIVIKKREDFNKIRNLIITIWVFIKSLQEKSLTGNSNKNLVKQEENNIILNNQSLDLTKRHSSLFIVSNEEIENEKDFIKEKYKISEEASLKNILLEESNIDMMNNLNETITNYQKFYINLLDIFYSIPEKSQITKMEISLFKKTTELMIRLQEYIKSNDIPEWYFFLEKIIFKNNINFKLSLEASRCLLDFNLSSFNDKEIYQKIKNNFSKEEVDSSIITEEEYKNKFNKIGVNKTCYELLLGKLYNKVNEQINQETIIDLLVKILRLDQERFLKILENTFNIKDFLEDNVKLFSDFWQFLNEYYNDLLIFKNGECLFQMLDFLDSENPLLRHLSKSWLDQSLKQYKKMVDPILKCLLDENIQILQGEKFYEIEKEYNAKILMDSFRRLKNLIINSPMMNFLIKNKPDDDIIEIFKNKKFFFINKDEINYFYMLISISLIYTQGQCNPNLSSSFKKINLSINATSCEFLEFLLSHVNNPDIIMTCAKNINFPILLLIDKALDDRNKNNVMQVQLLSLLKVLYFRTSSVHLKYKADALSLFGSQNLINCLSKGMTRDYYFVRENYINFIRECLPLFKNIMNDEVGKKTYYKLGGTFILALAVNLSRKISIDTIGRKDTERFSHFDEKNNANYFIFKNYLDEYKEYKLFDESDVLLILKGIKDITFYFLNIKPKPYNSIIWPDFKNTLIETMKKTSGIFNILFSSDNDKTKYVSDENIKVLFSTKIMDLMNCLLLTWINKSDRYEPYDFCLNCNGILPLKIANKDIFSDEDIKQGLNAIKKDPIKNIVKEISLNLFLTNPIEFLQTLIQIWCYTSSKKPKNIDISEDCQYKLTIIEYLISLNIPLNILLYCLNIIMIRNINAEKYKEKYEKMPPKYFKDPKTKLFILNINVGIFEAKLLHFIYSYILLNPFKEIKNFIYNNDPSKNEISEAYREMINLLNTILSDTKITYTYCWMYELLQLTLEKIKINKVSDNSVKYKLLDLFSTITEKLENCAFYNKVESKQPKEGKLILPYLPHVYLNIIKEIYPEYLLYLYNRNESGQNQNIKDNKSSSTLNQGGSSQDLSMNKNKQNQSSTINSQVQDFFSTYFAVAKLSTERLELSSTPLSKGDDLEIIYRQLACITLKDNFFKISINIYEDQSSFKKKLTDIIKKLIELLRTYNNVQGIKEDSEKYKEILFYIEFASEFLSSLMKDSPQLVTNCGKNMFMDYLKEPYFFITKPKVLRNFRQFISSLQVYYPEILSELIRNINSGFFLFGGSDEEKIKTLRRISFVIYSCGSDKFQNEFDNIKEKAKLFLTSYKDNSQLEQEIFLMMRILFLRFSHDGVMKMIKDLWPIIFTELIENFKNPNRNKNINLIIESFKFIELLSLANKEEFSLYQWIFLLDTFSMKDLDIKNQESLLSEILKKESQIFKPVVLDFLDKEHLEVSKEILEGEQKGKNTLVFCPENPTLEMLQSSIKKLFYSIGDMNNYKVELDSDQIEKLIEEDFIDYKNNKNVK